MITVTTPVAFLGSGLVLVAATSGIVAYTTGSGTLQAGAQPGPSVSSNNNVNGGGLGGGSIKGNPGHSITLTGAVSGTIRPGSPATLNVTINNPNNQDITVSSVTGSITSVTTGTLAGRPVCSASWFHVGNFTGSTVIAKNASAVVSVPVSLDDLNLDQDNCKGVTVQFSFSAQAQGA